MKQTQFRRAKCPECQGTYELIPPVDPSYKVPREKPTSDNYIKMVYECDEEHHLTTIYWEQEAFVAYVGKTSGNVTRR